MSVKRQFPALVSSSQFADLASMTREELVDKYEVDMRPMFDAHLMVARSVIVKRYRTASGVWPDTPLHRWYRKEDWQDDGKFIGPERPPRDAEEAKARFAEKDATFAHALETLQAVEAKLGVKPYKLPPVDDIARAVADEKRPPVNSRTFPDELTYEPIPNPLTPVVNENTAAPATTVNTDRAAYMREYMRKKRAAKADKPS